MTTKMTIRSLGVLIAGLACARPYIPAGMKNLDVSGYYDTAISLFSAKCSGISTENARIRVDHAPGALTFKLTYNLLSYDARIDHEGNFSTSPGPYRDANGQGSAYLSGKFTDSSFYARVYVTSPRQCEYQVRWSGRKL
jgi:hypothetical protein